MNFDFILCATAKELGGSFHENGYSIPQMQIRRKEKKNGF